MLSTSRAAGNWNPRHWSARIHIDPDRSSLQGQTHAGDRVQFDDNVIALETGKVVLDIQSLHAGRVIEGFVEAGQEVAEGTLILTIETD